MNKPHETHPTRENLEARIRELERELAATNALLASYRLGSANRGGEHE